MSAYPKDNGAQAQPMQARNQRKIRLLGCTWESFFTQYPVRRTGSATESVLPSDSLVDHSNPSRSTSDSSLPIDRWVDQVTALVAPVKLWPSSSISTHSSSFPPTPSSSSSSFSSPSVSDKFLNRQRGERYIPPHARHNHYSTDTNERTSSSWPRASRQSSSWTSRDMTTTAPIVLPDLLGQKPSKMAQREASNDRDSVEESDYHRIRQKYGFRPNYNGDVMNPANRPQEVPKELNCNLWITGLPADCTEGDLEVAIGKAGAIFAIHLNRPDLAIGHGTTAAHVAFMNVESARAFVDAKRKSGLFVKGHLANVGWNRNRVGPQNETNPAGKLRSRVLVIRGHPSIVNEESLTGLFRRYCKFFTTSIQIVAEEEDGSRTMEWRFARVAGQADLVAKCLYELNEQEGYGIKYHFARDPCEVDIVPSSTPQHSELQMGAQRRSTCLIPHFPHIPCGTPALTGI
ncbi:hypothetical protein PFICI_06828 [Pestalotiopsis fici W106-1]|uniref:RRM domain-containing protein n=1 Tax=Pestalotiopsis fici (strain W106-1 / CGMCC3.15140) TaxID=1229662 RepID=W3X9I8_PESFW|nr:uncharacterized protein PFICI_06828 [Pestalotiopsis fici W106-1]ETS81826.1 hypothetical protein PFICI_06828 [Pestalotiopsis fici W106-1]